MKKLLLIEDEAELRELITLHMQKKYEVCSAASIQEAKAISNDIEFDIILSDVHLKDGSAISFMSHLRSKGILTPLIVQSGDQDFETIRSCLQLGVVDYVLKPWRFDEMHKKIEKVLLLEEKRKSVFSNNGSEKHDRKIFGLVQVSLKNSTSI